MNNKFICPMMYGMPTMYQTAPLGMQPGMLMGEEMEMDNYYEDEEDDRLMMKMYPESCKKMMIYVKVEIDSMEEKDEAIHDNRLNREMVEMITDNAYKKMVKEMPEMAEEETRQYPIRRFSRDLLRLLLLNELFRRRRRRRRLYYGYPFGLYDYDYDYDDYYDYD